MRPYLAILKDSFREAFASWLLWILLLLITLTHIGLAGFQVRSTTTFRLGRSDLAQPGRLARELVEAVDQDPSPAHAIAQRLPEELIAELKNAIDPDGNRSRFRNVSWLVNELNDQLEQPGFLDRENWKSVALSDEGRKLRDGQLDDVSDSERGLLHRKALDTAFPASIRPLRGEAVSVSWFGMSLAENEPTPMQQVRETFRDQILVGLLNGLLGILGVFVAILVTASIIPRTFEPGEIDLLLSKPVSRSLLFVTKFVGGCAFITLLAGYFIGGLWLLIGWRLEMWMPRLLLCIPTLVFVFAILYSVSTLVGVIWRNSILCVVLTLLFWFSCTIARVTKESIELNLNGQRAEVIVDVDGHPWMARKSGQLVQWNEEESDWIEVAAPRNKGMLGRGGMAFPYVGPVYDSHHERVVAIRYNQAGPLPMFRSNGRVVLMHADEDWQPVEGATVRDTVRTMSVDGQGRLLLVGPNGIDRYEGGDPSNQQQPFVMLGIDVAEYVKPDEQGRFVSAMATPVTWRAPFDAAVSADGDRIVVADSEMLTVLEPNQEDQWEVSAARTRDESSSIVVGIGGDRIVSADSSGLISVLDAQTLETAKTFQPFGETKPKSVQVSANGKFAAVVFHNRSLWLCNLATNKPLKSNVTGQGDVSSVSLGAEDELWVSDRFGRVIQYQLPGLLEVSEFEPDAGTQELVYRYAVKPIYTVFPKPGQLDEVVRYIVTEDETAGMPGAVEDLKAERDTLDVGEAIWSNLAFLAVMLGLTSLWVYRRDF